MFPYRSDFDTDEDWMHEVEKAGFKYIYSVPCMGDLYPRVMEVLDGLYTDREIIESWHEKEMTPEGYYVNTGHSCVIYVEKSNSIAWAYRETPYMRHMTYKSSLNIYSKSKEDLESLLSLANFPLQLEY